MKLGIKEILVGATLAIGCNNSKPQAPVQSPPVQSPIDECRSRALAIVKNFINVTNSTGMRFDSWDSAGGKEWQACLEEKKLPLDSRLVQ